MLLDALLDGSAPTSSSSPSTTADQSHQSRFSAIPISSQLISTHFRVDDWMASSTTGLKDYILETGLLNLIHFPIEAQILFHLCMTLVLKSCTMHSLKDVELAGLLIQPQRWFSNENIQDLCSSPIERFRSISRIFVVFKKDMPLIKEFQL
ncbi:hypothetical protein F2Q69_00037944 [Brassica cretica]|uniref:Uncharacterized protein n=1 Tax=Brassica cretica TaxID=69181 RepID=A0A8S9SS65_BRACR|nr:hypothetical protein F2Q69_00037944 [Brassica cretica]